MIGAITIAGLIILAIAIEIFALARWSRWYFLHGITVFKYSGRYNKSIQGLLSSHFSDADIKDKDIPAILHKKVDENTFFLREEMLHFRKKHSGIIRVSLIHEGENGDFVLVGNLNVSSFLPLILFVYFLMHLHDVVHISIFVLVSLFIILTTIVSYRDEAKRYKEFAKILSV